MDIPPALIHLKTPVLFFDGVCNLCNFWVFFIINRDIRNEFLFGTLQSNLGRRLAQELGLPIDKINSLILIDEKGVHMKSEAALRILLRLGFPWSLAGIFLVLPRFLRDAVYDGVARVRYRWFGKKDSCPLPTEDLKKRFVS